MTYIVLVEASMTGVELMPIWLALLLQFPGNALIGTGAPKFALNRTFPVEMSMA